MIENVTIVDKNGNGIIAEGIIYLQYLSNAKKYITYTLNEKVNNDLNKMYVAETTDEIGSLEKMPDEDWNIIKGILNNLSTGEESADIQFLKMNNDTFNIGIPKKLAITSEVKQALKDLYFKKMLEINQQQGVNTPAVSSAISTSQMPTQQVAEVPAFAPTPSPQDVYNNSVQQNYYQDSSMGNISPQEIAPMPSAINAMASSYNGAPTYTSNDGQNSLLNYNDPVNQGQIQGYSHEMPISNYNDSDIVTKEEALKALDILNRYFKYTKELPSSLAMDFKEYNNVVPFKPKEGNQSYNTQQGMINSSASVVTSGNFNNAQQTSYIQPNQSYEQMTSNNNIAYSGNNMDYMNNQFARTPDVSLGMPAEIPRGNSYMATNNNAALNMNYSNGYVKDVPVALPSNYNQFQMPTNDIVLGPGSLPSPEIRNKYIA